jgi:hypothetical protein
MLFEKGGNELGFPFGFVETVSVPAGVIDPPTGGRVVLAQNLDLVLEAFEVPGESAGVCMPQRATGGGVAPLWATWPSTAAAGFGRYSPQGTRVIGHSFAINVDEALQLIWKQNVEP